MSEIKFPVSELDDNKFKVIVDMNLYAKESVVAACYKYTDRFYVHQLTSNNKIEVVLESKESNTVSEIVIKQFCNELIDQQVRFNTNLQFGHIRNLIVEEAFKPVSR